MQKDLFNIAFIDGQNLHLDTKAAKWSIDHVRFRRYLLEKYNIKEAYYFLGYFIDDQKNLYQNLEKAGFIILFKEHSSMLAGKKKGNVDSDIIFEVMKKLVENESFGKAFIVSGDGDYKKLVDFLLKRSKFGKMLFPNKEFTSSLYANLGGEFFDYLENQHVRTKIVHV